MKKIMVVLVGILIMPLVTQANEYSGFYMGSGFNVLDIDGIKMSRAMQNVANTPGVSVTYHRENKDTFATVITGYRLNKYFGIEGTWTPRAAEFSDKFTIESVNIGTIDIGGYPVEIGKVPINLIVIREAEVTYYSASGVLYLPITTHIEGTVKVGALWYDIEAETQIPIYRGIYLSQAVTFKGVVPLVSFGGSVKFLKNFRFEGEFTKGKNAKKITINLIRNF